MIFLPITDGGWDGHVTRIGTFVVFRQFFGRAVAGYVVVLELRKSRNQVRFSNARRNLVAKPFGPRSHAFIQRVEMRGDRAFHQTEMRKIKVGRI